MRWLRRIATVGLVALWAAAATEEFLAAQQLHEGRLCASRRRPRRGAAGRPGRAHRPCPPWTTQGAGSDAARRAAPDGSVELSHDTTTNDDYEILVGATPHEAYLVRRAGIAARDLATGAERTVLPLGRAGDAVHVEGGRIVVMGSGSAGAVFDLATGRRTATPCSTRCPARSDSTGC